ncbi:MAG: F0F1 ATP synthase subunit A [Nocardioidaceae bacterium]
MSAPQTVMASTEITIGEHRTFELFGLTFNADTIWSTVIAGAIVIGLGFWMRSKVNSRVPSKIQVMWETLVNWVTGQVESSLGRIHPFVVPLAIALFAFILIANWLELIPSEHWLTSPTADVNTTYALAFFVIIGVHVNAIRTLGFKGAYAHLFQPYKALFPILLIEEIVKPFTLALRLFGNIFSGGIMLSMIGLFPAWLLWGPNGVWKLFDIFIGLIQAFIFALLTILYFGMAIESHEEESDTSEPREAEAGADREERPHADSPAQQQGAPA